MMVDSQFNSQNRIKELAEIASSKFDWHWAPIRIHNQVFKIATASDPEALLIDACTRQDAGEQGVVDPFWAAVWRASAGLDQYLDNLELDGVDVLEIGCGTGRVGVAAALRGANVVLTDGVDDPLLLAEMTVWPLRDRCRVEKLRFGEDQILDDQGRPKRFPLILGSDVTYLRELWPEILVTTASHLTDGGVLILSDPYRMIADEFLEWIDREIYSVNVSKEVLKEDPDGRPIRIMEIRLKSNSDETSRE